MVAHVIIGSAQVQKIGFWGFSHLVWLLGQDLGTVGTGDGGLGLGLDNFFCIDTYMKRSKEDKSSYQFATWKLLDFLFLVQTSSISDQITGSLFSAPFAPPITNKSVSVIVFLTRASITTHFCLPGNVCFLFWYFLLVNYDPISQRASVLWQHPFSLPSARHTISLPPLSAWRQYISLSDIKIYSYNFLISL